MSGGGEPGVFVSYRRSDSAPVAQAIAMAIEREFGRNRVFVDVEGIASGEPFEARIKASLEQARVFLAVIGPKWSSVQDKRGRRLEDEQDWVRREVAFALQHTPVVIPVVLDGTKLDVDELPAPLKGLCDRNYFELKSDRLQHGINELLGRLVELGLEPRVRAHPTRMAIPIACAHFVGRSAEVEELLDCVRRRAWAGIFEVSGLGKSALAARVATLAEEQKVARCVWLAAGAATEPFSLLRVLAGAVGSTIEHIADAQDQIAHLYSETAENELLIVVDDVTRDEVLSIILQSIGPGNSVIVTGQDRGLTSIVRRGLRVVRLKHLTDEEGASMLRLLSGSPKDPATDEAWLALARTTAGFPFVLEAVAGELVGLGAAADIAEYARSHAGSTPIEVTARIVSRLDSDLLEVFLALGVCLTPRVAVAALASMLRLDHGEADRRARGLAKRLLVDYSGEQIRIHDALRGIAARSLCETGGKQYEIYFDRYVAHYQALLRTHGGFEWYLREYPKLVPHEETVLGIIDECLNRWERGDVAYAGISVRLVFDISWYLHWRGYSQRRYLLCGKVLELASRYELAPSNMLGNLCIDQGWIALRRRELGLARKLADRGAQLVNNVDALYASELAAQLDLEEGDAERARQTFQELFDHLTRRQPGMRTWYVLAFRLSDALAALARHDEHDALLASVIQMLEHRRENREVIDDVHARILFRWATRGPIRFDDDATYLILKRANELFIAGDHVTPERVKTLVALADHRLQHDVTAKQSLITSAWQLARTMGLPEATDLDQRRMALAEQPAAD